MEFINIGPAYILTLSLGHHFTKMCDTTKRWPSDKVKENFETNLKVHCAMQLLSSYMLKVYGMINFIPVKCKHEMLLCNSEAEISVCISNASYEL